MTCKDCNFFHYTTAYNDDGGYCFFYPPLPPAIRPIVAEDCPTCGFFIADEGWKEEEK